MEENRQENDDPAMRSGSRADHASSIVVLKSLCSSFKLRFRVLDGNNANGIGAVVAYSPS
jgi:hypothetical protein